MADKANLKGSFEIENELSVRKFNMVDRARCLTRSQNSKQQLDAISNELMVDNAFDLLSNMVMPKNQKDIKNFFVPLPGKFKSCNRMRVLEA